MIDVSVRFNSALMLLRKDGVGNGDSAGSAVDNIVRLARQKTPAMSVPEEAREDTVPRAADEGMPPTSGFLGCGYDLVASIQSRHLDESQAWNEQQDMAYQRMICIVADVLAMNVKFLQLQKVDIEKMDQNDKYAIDHMKYFNDHVDEINAKTAEVDELGHYWIQSDLAQVGFGNVIHTDETCMTRFDDFKINSVDGKLLMEMKDGNLIQYKRDGTVDKTILEKDLARDASLQSRKSISPGTYNALYLEQAAEYGGLEVSHDYF